MKLGRNLARTFLDYYKLQNLIIFNPVTAIVPKTNNSSFFNFKSGLSNLGSVNLMALCEAVSSRGGAHFLEHPTDHGRDPFPSLWATKQ